METLLGRALIIGQLAGIVITFDPTIPSKTWRIAIGIVMIGYTISTLIIAASL